jgi:hypothetical protein
MTMGASIFSVGFNEPHSTPAEFASSFTPIPRRALALRYAKSSAPASVASPVRQDIQKRQKRTHGWIKLGGKVTSPELARPSMSMWRGSQRRIRPLAFSTPPFCHDA